MTRLFVRFSVVLAAVVLPAISQADYNDDVAPTMAALQGEKVECRYLTSLVDEALGAAEHYLDCVKKTHAYTHPYADESRPADVLSCDLLASGAAENYLDCVKKNHAYTHPPVSRPAVPSCNLSAANTVKDIKQGAVYKAARVMAAKHDKEPACIAAQLERVDERVGEIESEAVRVLQSR